MHGSPGGVPKGFELGESYACYRPQGNYSLREAVDAACKAVAFCREQGIKRLLIDATRMKGFCAPTTLQRYEMARRFVREARSALKVVFVAAPELIDPETFGATVARNRGLRVNVFSSEPEAAKWLSDPDAA